MQVSISELALWTGIDRRKIRRRLADLHSEKGQKGARLFESKDALLVLYTGADESRESEEFRLTRIRADRADLELQSMRGDLLPRDEVVRDVQDIFGAVRSKLLSLPGKAAPEVALMKKPTAIRAHIEKLIHEALRELVSYQPRRK